jgi:hypothetical protein
MKRAAEGAGIHDVFVAHVGMGHFLVVLNLDDYEVFCRRVVKKFDSELQWNWKLAAARQPHGAQENSFRRGGSQLTLKLSIGVIHNQYKEYWNASTMLSALSGVHREAQQLPTSSYFVCRRRVAV